MHTAQIEERVLVLVYKHKTEKYREPHQHQRTADEPLPQAHHTHPHQLQSRHSQEHENQERRYTETIIYQIAGQLRTAATGVVLHPIIGGNQLLRTASVNDALVCRSREKERRKGEQQINRKDYQYQADNEMNSFTSK